MADSSVVKRMVDSMLHEPSYRSGALGDDRLGFHAGWIAHAGSFADQMPVWNERRDRALIFTGENFSDEGGNASHVLRTYEEQGPKCFSRLNGQFSGLIVDWRHQALHLFNDHYGLGRVYIHENNSAFYFASETKALLAALPGLRQVDYVGLAEFFSCGCPLQDRTLFKGVSLLPGGSAWTFSPGKPVARSHYFSPAQLLALPKLSADAYYEKLKAVFPLVVGRYLKTPQPIAMSLTGGIDSRMIMAWAQRGPGELPTYTFSGMYRECADVRLARAVANICGQPHQSLRVGDEFLREFPDLSQRTVYLTDGNMDVSGAPDLYVNRIAAQIAPVRLTGNYGGEVLRSIVTFRPRSLSGGVLDLEFSRTVASTAETYALEFRLDPRVFIATRQVPWHHYNRLAVESTQLTVRSPYLDKDLVALAFQTPAELATSNAPALRLIAEGNPHLGAMQTDRALAHGRMPAWKHRWQEFTFKAEYAYDYGMPQWLARLDTRLRALQPERAFLGRHKFYHFRLWYRDQLSGWLKSVLLDPRALARPYLEPKAVERIVKAHTSGAGNFTLEIHKLMSTELFHRYFID